VLYLLADNSDYLGPQSQQGVREDMSVFAAHIDDCNCGGDDACMAYPLCSVKQNGHMFRQSSACGDSTFCNVRPISIFVFKLSQTWRKQPDKGDSCRRAVPREPRLLGISMCCDHLFELEAFRRPFVAAFMRVTLYTPQA